MRLRLFRIWREDAGLEHESRQSRAQHRRDDGAPKETGLVSSIAAVLTKLTLAATGAALMRGGRGHIWSG